MPAPVWLFSSVVEVLENDETFVNGMPTYVWAPIPLGNDLGGSPRTTVKCRIDTTFIPPGTQPPVIEAGRAPDRHAIAWFEPWLLAYLRPGQRFHCLSGPVFGVWSLDAQADTIGDYGTLHHLQVPLKEVSQVLVAEH